MTVKKVVEERTPAEGDKSFDKMRTGGSNSQYNADGTKKTKKKEEGKSYNIKTTDNPKGGLRNKDDEKSYPSGVGSGG